MKKLPSEKKRSIRVQVNITPIEKKMIDVFRSGIHPPMTESNFIYYQVLVPWLTSESEKKIRGQSEHPKPVHPRQAHAKDI